MDYKIFDPHGHSMFSNFRLIDSINRPKDMILKAYELGYAGISLTDHETVAGHVEWLNYEKELKSPKLSLEYALNQVIFNLDHQGNAPERP